MLYMYVLYHTNNVCLSSSGHLTFLANHQAGKKRQVSSPESRIQGGEVEFKLS